MRLAVVVLGDLGRSPRMQYHARAAALSGMDVDLLGEAGRPVHPAVRAAPRLRIHEVPASRSSPAARERRLAPAAVAAGARTLAFLRAAARFRPSPEVLLVQVPPTLPTLLVALAASRRHRARLVIDWHNFESAMLALRLGRTHRAVRLSAALERRLARKADAHLCVSAAMRATLAERIGVHAEVLPDRPEEWFSPIPADERESFFRRHPAVFPGPRGGDVRALVVTSTSWSADEDLPLLLAALRRLDERIESETDRGGKPFPGLLVAISGDGPLRAAFEQSAASVPLRHVNLHTLWLDPEDYPRFLAAADLGVSCHRSASGVDLAMKVADMQGAGLAVCALDYGPCLGEQIRHGENGLRFATAEELSTQLHELFRGFPEETPLLDRLRRGVADGRGETFPAAWRRIALPLLSRLAR